MLGNVAFDFGNVFFCTFPTMKLKKSGTEEVINMIKFKNEILIKIKIKKYFFKIYIIISSFEKKTIARILEYILDTN